MAANHVIAIARTNREEIIDRVANGQYLTEIAKDYGCTNQALSAIIKDDPEYIAAKESGMESRLDKANQLLDEITLDATLGKATNEVGERLEAEEQSTLIRNSLDLARIREIGLKRIEWRAEREFSHRWGNKQTVTIDVDLSGALADARARVRPVDLIPDVEDIEVIEQ